MRSLKKRGPHVLDDLMTSYFPYNCMLHKVRPSSTELIKSIIIVTVARNDKII